MYGCRLKSVNPGLGCCLGWTPALSVTHSVAEAAYASCAATCWTIHLTCADSANKSKLKSSALTVLITGSASQNVSPSKWQLWRIDPSTAPLRPIYSRVSPRVSDMTSRRRLRSSTSHRLEVPSVRLPTVGKRAFPVSVATIWNVLSLHVATTPKTFLFSRSYQDTIIWLVCYYYHSPLLCGHL